MIRFYFDEGAGFIGLVLLLFSIVLHITNNISLALGVLICSFIFVNFYLFHHIFILLVRDMEGRDWMLSALWRKYKHFFALLSYLLYPYLYFLFYMTTDSYWIPLLFIFSLIFFIRKFTFVYTKAMYKK